jgi:hypothetical protein
LLTYEEAVALKDLAAETQIESRSMCHLTVDCLYQKHYAPILTVFQERSTEDAAAVKILTVITLVYLPTTIVAVSSFK